MTARPRPWTHVTLWLGVVAVVAGVVVAATAPSSPASFGWYAYAPLSGSAFVAGRTPWQLWTGVGLAVVGAVAAAFASGRLSVRPPR
ncbi:hypothetical protein [Curtobacterium sp. VKM Ac-2922]|uniref:hypothetical protein n=1 Tax=Curtobacterium sp. VKM Ac-2922 TaxID=2929475 RepID=UPI001FB21A2A|nr:hypothetical protein [Curtobacterium sp. VKM Ac-2922]MCJ1715902.1 hypothetical protein [Curtobacterium sp. VKM Ac-2922]